MAAFQVNSPSPTWSSFTTNTTNTAASTFSFGQVLQEKAWPNLRSRDRHMLSLAFRYWDPPPLATPTQHLPVVMRLTPRRSPPSRGRMGWIRRGGRRPL